LFTICCAGANQYIPRSSAVFGAVLFGKVELFAHFTRQEFPSPATFAGQTSQCGNYRRAQFS
jgi:hypothetical protein